MRDYKQEMRDYGMSEGAIQLAERISEILNISFEKVVRTKHGDLLVALVEKIDSDVK